MKLSIIMADRSYLTVAEQFHQCDSLDIEVLLLDHCEDLPNKEFGFALKIFEPVASMPNYFRGLADHLKGCDVVMVINSHHRTSFQALSVACKLDKPLCLYQNNDKPELLVNDSDDARAMHQVIRAADHIFATHQGCVDYLLSEGADECKLSILHPDVSESFVFCNKRRQKFRSYIGVEPRSILLYSDLGDSKADAEKLIRAIKSLLRKKPLLARRFRALIRISCDNSSLTYLASDLGIGSHVLTINQDVAPFATDLYSSAEIVVSIADLEKSFPSNWIMEAASCGAVPVIGEYCDAKLFGDSEVTCVGADFLNLSEGLIEAVHIVDQKSRAELGVASSLNSTSSNVEGMRKFINIIQSVKEGYAVGNEKLGVDFENVRIQCEECIGREEYNQAVDLAKSLEVLANQDILSRSIALRLQGELSYKLGKLDEATKLLDESVQLNSKNWKSFLTLGKISLRMHSEEDAIVFFKKVLAQKPNQVQALAGIGTVHRMLGMVEESVYWLHRALSLDMTNSKLLFELTQAALECEELGDPIIILESLRGCIGERQCIVMALGQLYMRAGKVEKGRAMVAKGLEGGVAHEEQRVLQD